MSLEVSKSPKILLSFDHLHSDVAENKVTDSLCKLKPHEKIIIFCETRFIEQDTLGQYSIELLSKDNKYSTASSNLMLLSHLMVGSGYPAYLKPIISNMYSDSYFKTLFIGDHYKKYSPHKYRLSSVDQFFSYASISANQTNAINNVKGLFAYLDSELPKLPVSEQEYFFEYHVSACVSKMEESKDLFCTAIFSPISEALAVIKINEIQKKLGVKFDDKKDISLDLVKKIFYNTTEGSVDMLEELNNRRTVFQVEKIVSVVKKIMQSSSNPAEITFLARVGLGHKQDIMLGLQTHFGKDSVKEIDLLNKPLDNLAELIKSSSST